MHVIGEVMVMLNDWVMLSRRDMFMESASDVYCNIYGNKCPHSLSN